MHPCPRPPAERTEDQHCGFLPALRKARTVAALPLAVVLDGGDHAGFAAATATPVGGRNYGRCAVFDFPPAPGSGLGQAELGQRGEMNWLWSASDFVRKIR